MGDQRRWEGRTTIKKNEREGGKCQNTIAHFHDGGRIYDTRYVIVYIFLFFYFKILIHFIYFSAKQVKKNYTYDLEETRQHIRDETVQTIIHLADNLERTDLILFWQSVDKNRKLFRHIKEFYGQFGCLSAMSLKLRSRRSLRIC